MKPNNIKFAFLVHPRGVDDIRKKYFFAKFIPAGILKFVIKFLNPRVASIIKGLKDKKGNEIRGLIIAVLLTPSQMLSLKRSFVQKNRRFVRRCGVHFELYRNAQNVFP